MPFGDTTYAIEVTDINGCKARDEINIQVKLKKNVWWPNIFTPNEDGENDGFTIYGDKGLDKIEWLRIYDRWGELVFETHNIDPNEYLLGWDGTFKGKDVVPGVYVFITNVKFIDGSNGLYKGDVTVLR